MSGAPSDERSGLSFVVVKANLLIWPSLTGCQSHITTDDQSVSQSHVTTDDQSVSKSWIRAPYGSRDRKLISVWFTSIVLSIAGAPSDARSGLPFVVVIVKVKVTLRPTISRLGWCPWLIQPGIGPHRKRCLDIVEWPSRYQVTSTPQAYSVHVTI
jgi:hypothetical protein